MQRTIDLGEHKIVLQTRTIKEAISLIDNLDITINKETKIFNVAINKKGYGFYCWRNIHTLQKIKKGDKLTTSGDSDC